VVTTSNNYLYKLIFKTAVAKILYILFLSISAQLETIPKQTRNGNILVTLLKCFQKRQLFCCELTAKHERAAVVFLPLYFYLLRSEQRSKRI